MIKRLRTAIDKFSNIFLGDCGLEKEEGIFYTTIELIGIQINVEEKEEE